MLVYELSGCGSEFCFSLPNLQMTNIDIVTLFTNVVADKTIDLCTDGFVQWHEMVFHIKQQIKTSRW